VISCKVSSGPRRKKCNTLFDDVTKLTILFYTNELLELVMKTLKNKTSKKTGVKAVWTLAAVPTHQTWLHLEKKTTVIKGNR